MDSVAFVDLLTFVTVVGVTIALIVASRRLPFKKPMLFFVFVFFLDLYYGFLFLEWYLSSSLFDRLEDFTGALIPMLWAFLFYTILQEMGHRKLEHNQHRYQMVVDNISELIVKLDDENRILFASPSFCTIIGKSEEELIGTPYQSVMGMEDDHSVFEHLDRAKAPSYTAVYETPLDTQYGLRWIAWSARGVVEPTDKAIRILAVGRDVTEKKKAEQSLIESEARHRQFIENQSVGMFRSIIEGNGRFLMANLAMAKLFGYPTVESFLKVSSIDIYKNPVDRQHVLTRLRETGKIFGLEIEGKKKDGSTLNLRMTLQLNRDIWGIPVQVDGTLEDITARKKAEAALQESRDLHCQAQRLAKLGHWELQIDSHSYSGSEELYRIFEIHEIRPLQWNRFIEGVHIDDRALVNDELSKIITTGIEGDVVYRFVFPDKRIKFIHSKGHAVHNNAGKAIKVIGTVQDVTDLKEAEMAKEASEQKLRQAQKMEAIGTLAGGIAHDFNNILTSLIGFTQIAMAKLPKGHAAAGHLDHVLQAGLRAGDLVGQILTFSRQSEQKVKTIQLSTIVKEVMKLLRATIPANIEIRQKINIQDGFVLAEPTRIHQILMNLCTNAYQSIGQENGLISVSLKEVDIGPRDFLEVSELIPGKYAQISVSDNGHGMAPEIISRVFDPYFTTKRKGEGTGLGLAVVHGIIREYKGHITAYSEPGRGTSFNVYLPCAEAVKDSCQGDIEKPIIGGSEHILIIDDEESILLMMTDLLNCLGYRVTAFTLAEQAVEFLQSRPGDCDLVITDLIMPTMSGEALARRIHQVDPCIPILIQTGFSDDLILEGLDSIGVAAVLRKPILQAELTRCIRKTLESKRCKDLGNNL